MLVWRQRKRKSGIRSARGTNRRQDGSLLLALTVGAQGIRNMGDSVELRVALSRQPAQKRRPQSYNHRGWVSLEVDSPPEPPGKKLVRLNNSA